MTIEAEALQLLRESRSWISCSQSCQFRSQCVCGADSTLNEINDLLQRAAAPKDRGVFLLDVEHDEAALQALETYAYAVSKAGDRPLCDELIAKINEVRARRQPT